MHPPPLAPLARLSSSSPLTIVQGQDVSGAAVNRDGTDEFVVKFTPAVAGEYSVALLNDGKPVDGASKTFTVLPRLVAKMVEQVILLLIRSDNCSYFVLFIL